MQKYRAFIVLACLSLLSAAPVAADKDKVSVLSGNEARRENFQVNKRINWYNNLEQARQDAAKSGRLVFWVHMLGSMDGKT
ncbi:MAG: hypothetical protein K2X27_20520 [Candidatus Obscuribacterales bacterium]|nr:hypothetical protein [Candidatus Obscuribacterales bacterium]